MGPRFPTMPLACKGLAKQWPLHNSTLQRLFDTNSKEFSGISCPKAIGTCNNFGLCYLPIFLGQLAQQPQQRRCPSAVHLLIQAMAFQQPGQRRCSRKFRTQRQSFEGGAIGVFLPIPSCRPLKTMVVFPIAWPSTSLFSIDIRQAVSFSVCRFCISLVRCCFPLIDRTCVMP